MANTASSAFFSPILADGVLCEYNACREGILLFDFQHEQPSGGGKTDTSGSGKRVGWMVVVVMG